MHRNLLIIEKITFSGVYVGLIVGLQVALSPFPNIETVTLFLLVGGVNLPLSLIGPIGLGFVILELLVYGFGTWFFFYLAVWPLLILGTFLLRPLIKRHWWISVIWATIFGFGFGTVDALLKGIFFGTSGLLAYWIQGLIFDLIHGISNFLILFCCYLPLAKALTISTTKFQTVSFSHLIFWRWCSLNWYLSKQRIIKKWNQILAN